MFSVLSDEDSLRILFQLLEAPRTRRELEEKLGLKEGKVLWHINGLRGARLVTYSRSGGKHSYMIEPRAEKFLRALLELSKWFIIPSREDPAVVNGFPRVELEKLVRSSLNLLKWRLLGGLILEREYWEEEARLRALCKRFGLSTHG